MLLSTMKNTHEVQEAVCSWLEACLRSMQRSSLVTDEQLANFHRAVTNAQTAPDVTHAIREFVRLWR